MRPVFCSHPSLRSLFLLQSCMTTQPFPSPLYAPEVGHHQVKFCSIHEPSEVAPVHGAVQVGLVVGLQATRHKCAGRRGHQRPSRCLIHPFDDTEASNSANRIYVTLRSVKKS